MAGRGDAEVVHGWALANVLRAWVDQWERERPPWQLPTGTRPMSLNRSEYDFVSPIVWLADETNIHERRLRAYVKGEIKYPGIRQVDKILKAIDRPHYLTNGELEVIKNPYWSVERWRAYMAERGCI